VYDRVWLGCFNVPEYSTQHRLSQIVHFFSTTDPTFLLLFIFIHNSANNHCHTTALPPFEPHCSPLSTGATATLPLPLPAPQPALDHAACQPGLAEQAEIDAIRRHVEKTGGDFAQPIVCGSQKCFFWPCFDAFLAPFDGVLTPFWRYFDAFSNAF
jgi:hypothetical protein